LLPGLPLLVLLLFDECQMEFNPDLDDTRASLSCALASSTPLFEFLPVPFPLSVQIKFASHGDESLFY